MYDRCLGGQTSYDVGKTPDECERQRDEERPGIGERDTGKNQGDDCQEERNGAQCEFGEGCGFARGEGAVPCHLVLLPCLTGSGRHKVEGARFRDTDNRTGSKTTSTRGIRTKLIVLNGKRGSGCRRRVERKSRIAALERLCQSR